MRSELIVDVQPKEVSIALLEEGRLMSLQKEATDIAYAVGDIYLAKVKKLMPGLNAAFVNVGYDKDAFLHYLDLGSQFSTYSSFLAKALDKAQRVNSFSLDKIKRLPDINKQGSISDVLTPGQELLVQIVKEPISSKGPRLTTEITLTGRYMVLIPFGEKVSISQKIKTSEEKMRLRQLVESIRPKNFGVIIRTSAEGKRVAELVHEMNTLVKYWNDTLAKARSSEAPALVFQEESRIVGVLRDIFNPDFESIYVNDADTYQQILNYVTLIAPDRKDIVKLYTKDEPIFDHFSITRQIKSSFGKTVSFRSGAYIIIEHTEALHVIDVNSGNRSKAANDQESNALEVNLRAADEIARQLRLRDMGGIIVIDFIDMAKAEHRQELYDHMREIMATDRARHNILPLSKFGLMQITRQRVRPVLDIHTEETCPSCYGRGEIQPSLLFTDTLYEKLDTLVNHMGMRDFIMYVHPYVEGYLKRGWLMSIFAKWRRKLGGNFKIIADESLAYLQYRVVSKDGKELDLKEAKDMNAATAEKREQKARKRGDAAEEADDVPVRQTKVKAKTVADELVEPAVEETAVAKDAPMSKSKKRRQRRKKAAENAAAETLAAAEAPASAMSARESDAPASIVASDAVAVASVADKPAETDAPASEVETAEAPKKKRRRSRSKKSESQEGQSYVLETAPAESEAQGAEAPATTEEETRAPKPKRRRKKSEASSEDAPALLPPAETPKALPPAEEE